jgi:heme-degrading monooxygenase HmoA
MNPSSSERSDMDQNSTEVHGVNVFTVRPEDRPRVVELLRGIGPRSGVEGLISLQLLEEVGGDRLVNHMRWASLEDFRRAEEHPAVAAAVEAIGALVRTGEPGFFRTLHTQE